MRTAVKDPVDTGLVTGSTRLASGFAVVLAHQGGWDEILLVAGPIAVIVGGIALVKRRLERRLAEQSRSADETD